MVAMLENVAVVVFARERGLSTNKHSTLLNKIYHSHQGRLSGHFREVDRKQKLKPANKHGTSALDLYQQLLKELTSVFSIRQVSVVVWAAPVHHYHQQHKLDQDDVSKLDSMPPQNFLTYIMSEISIEDRETFMLYEKYRLKSFEANWPYKTGNLSGEMMAATGFYSMNGEDRVMCVFCRGSLHRWEQEDIPSDEHRISFPFCVFLQGHECGNVPINGKANTEAVGLRNRTEERAMEQRPPLHGVASNSTDSNFVEKVAHRQQEVMFEKARVLGFSQRRIDAAVRASNHRFTDISDLTDAIARVPYDGAGAGTTNNSIHLPELSLEEKNQSATNEISVIRRNNSSAGISSVPLCRRCPERGQQPSPASHVGVPCGDLILCDDCSQHEVERKSEKPDHQNKCPHCDKRLTATIKVFFS